MSTAKRKSKKLAAAIKSHGGPLKQALLGRPLTTPRCQAKHIEHCQASRWRTRRCDVHMGAARPQPMLARYLGVPRRGRKGMQ